MMLATSMSLTEGPSFPEKYANRFAGWRILLINLYQRVAFSGV